MANVLVIDVEATGATIRQKKQNGNGYLELRANPHSPLAKACLIGLDFNGYYWQYDIEYSGMPYKENVDIIQYCIDRTDFIVGQNLKYDLHWLKRYGINFDGKRVWDCQAVFFAIMNQQQTFPSMDEMALHYGLELKPDLVKDYWAKGIDTDEIPLDTLSEYLEHDVKTTKAIYEKQVEYVNSQPKAFQRLISIINQDLLVLQEMEYNGMKYNIDKSVEDGNIVEQEIKELDRKLVELVGSNIPVNFSSRYHISAVLFGGEISWVEKEDYEFTYADKKKGTVTKQRNVTRTHTFPRLVNPGKIKKLEKEGYFATGEDVLKGLKAKGKGKQFIDLILKRTELEKLRSVYLHGLPELITFYEWDNNTIHCNLNQSAAVTGRLSATKPNLQQVTGAVKHLFESRF